MTRRRRQTIAVLGRRVRDRANDAVACGLARTGLGPALLVCEAEERLLRPQPVSSATRSWACATGSGRGAQPRGGGGRALQNADAAPTGKAR